MMNCVDLLNHWKDIVKSLELTTNREDLNQLAMMKVNAEDIFAIRHGKIPSLAEASRCDHCSDCCRCNGIPF